MIGRQQLVTLWHPGIIDFGRNRSERSEQPTTTKAYAVPTGNLWSRNSRNNERRFKVAVMLPLPHGFKRYGINLIQRVQ